MYTYAQLYTAKSLKSVPNVGDRESVSQLGRLPALIRLPVPPPVAAAAASACRQDGQRPAPPPEQAAVVDGPLLGVRERGVGGVDPHEVVGGRAPPVDRHHVGVARPGQTPVRHLDLLARGARGDAEDLVEGRARRRHPAAAEEAMRGRRRRRAGPGVGGREGGGRGGGEGARAEGGGARRRGGGGGEGAEERRRGGHGTVRVRDSVIGAV
ncbi:uncharacterized protein J3R85_012589 [Psidium guajava]|nr:uncharacterized protein J3R85_012589 [Psidium guajava]